MLQDMDCPILHLPSAIVCTTCALLGPIFSRQDTWFVCAKHRLKGDQVLLDLPYHLIWLESLAEQADAVCREGF